MDLAPRLSTGVEGLDKLLGGGLVPCTLAVVVGDSGAGKTQFGLHFACQGQQQEGRPGVVFDTSARIDSQGHAHYAQHVFGWTLANHPRDRFSAERFFDAARRCGDYWRVFERQGHRVSQHEVGFDAWHDWQAELAAQLELTIDFFYSNFVRGTRRVADEQDAPVERAEQRPTQTGRDRPGAYLLRTVRRLRREGKVPGVIYGHGTDALPIAVVARELRAALNTAAGANQINGISFGLKDSSAAEDQARLAAVRALRAKAELYAGATGYRVSRLVSLSEGGGAEPSPVVPMMMARTAVAKTPVAAGELTVRIDVNGVYELAR